MFVKTGPPSTNVLVTYTGGCFPLSTPDSKQIFLPEGSIARLSPRSQHVDGGDQASERYPPVSPPPHHVVKAKL